MRLDHAPEPGARSAVLEFWLKDVVARLGEAEAPQLSDTIVAAR